jgi:hypothetical protein
MNVNSLAFAKAILKHGAPKNGEPIWATIVLADIKRPGTSRASLETCTFKERAQMSLHHIIAR